jgi:hypothetical protein
MLSRAECSDYMERWQAARFSCLTASELRLHEATQGSYVKTRPESGRNRGETASKERPKKLRVGVHVVGFGGLGS